MSFTFAEAGYFSHFYPGWNRWNFPFLYSTPREEEEEEEEKEEFSTNHCLARRESLVSPKRSLLFIPRDRPIRINHKSGGTHTLRIPEANVVSNLTMNSTRVATSYDRCDCF